ncbi:MAG: NAD(P)H-dependent oxidoreductase [Pseudomonadota bacterium]
MSNSILLLHASAREKSVSRMLADELAAGLGGEVTLRDLRSGVPHIEETFATRRGEEPSPPELALSDELIAELEAHDTLIIATPIYNFTVPSALKAWIDQIARPRRTFRYSEAGPEGLLTGKKAYVVISTGGTPVDSDADFGTPYLRFALGFVGIDDVTVLAADSLGDDADKKLDDVRAQIADLTGKAAA